MRIAAAIIAVAAVLAGAARAEDLPDQRPILRIEPGMHTAPIKRIGVDAACRLMVTGSEDKTARLWALPEGGRGVVRLLRTLRVPIGEGNEGQVLAVALSPDGKWVAAGGWDVKAEQRHDNGVYVFEAATGRLAARLDHLRNVILHLAFSPDSSRLAVTLGAGKGMLIWETGSWRLLGEDKNYGGSQSYGAAFDGTNRLYTVADDRKIRRYSADGRLQSKASAQGGKEPYSIAVHPDGAKLAIGFFDTASVEVYDARTLKPLYAADASGMATGKLFNVVWSTDGARLYAAGDYQSDRMMPVVIWQDEGRGQRSEAQISQDSVAQLMPCGDGIAAGAGDPAFGLIAADGGKRVWQEGVTADMRDKKREAFTLSVDGGRVRFGLSYGSARPVLFDLATFQLSDAAETVNGLTSARTSGLSVSDWENEFTPKLNGRAIALKLNEISRSLAIAPDVSRFVLGAGFTIRAYRADGRELWDRYGPGEALGVNISRDGRLVAAAYGDGTIRWHRLSDGQELLALFVHAKDRRFVA